MFLDVNVLIGNRSLFRIIAFSTRTKVHLMADPLNAFENGNFSEGCKCFPVESFKLEWRFKEN